LLVGGYAASRIIQRTGAAMLRLCIGKSGGEMGVVTIRAKREQLLRHAGSGLGIVQRRELRFR